MQTANFLGDTLAERRAFTFNRTYYFFSPKYSPVRWQNGLGGYRRNEPQSICMSVHMAISKRIEEVKRLQYAPAMLCHQMQGSLHKP
jgi:hypothetical protein